MRRAGWLVGPLVVALLAGCTGGSAPESEIFGSSPGVPSSAPVAPDTPTEVASGGVTVSLPAGAVSGAGQVSVEPIDVSDLPDVPDGVLPLTPVSVQLRGAELVEPATVAFPQPEPASGAAADDPVVVLWQDSQGRWRARPTEQLDGRIVARTNHFSFGFTARVDVDRWIADRKDDLGRFFTGRSDVSQPSCGDEQLAREAGVEVTSDGGDAVKWCYGIEGGKTVLKIANNRRSFATITFPAAWKVQDGFSAAISPDGAARLLGSAADEFINLGKGMNSRTISGGDTLTLVVGPNASGTASVQGDLVAWAFSGVVFGMDVFTGVAGALGVYPKDADTFTRLAKALNGEGQDGYFQAFLSCTRAKMDELSESPADLAIALDSVLKFMWQCIPALMTADVAATGLKMFGAGLVLQTVGVIVGTILTGLHLVFTGIREIWDSFATFGGESDVAYDIRIRRPAGASGNLPQGVTIWYPGKAEAMVPGMWALQVDGSKFVLASNTEGLQCMSGKVNGARTSYRYHDQDFDFPPTTGTGTGVLRMSGANLVVSKSHGARTAEIVAIPGASANKSWVTMERGTKALADCADRLRGSQGGSTLAELDGQSVWKMADFDGVDCADCGGLRVLQRVSDQEFRLVGLVSYDSGDRSVHCVTIRLAHGLWGDEYGTAWTYASDRLRSTGTGGGQSASQYWVDYARVSERLVDAFLAESQPDVVAAYEDCVG